jgi:hypothetical protein
MYGCCILVAERYRLSHVMVITHVKTHCTLANLQSAILLTLRQKAVLV